MTKKLPDIDKMIATAKRESFEEQRSQLLLAKVPIPAPPQGDLNVTEISTKKKLLKYESARLYSQLGITATALNNVKALYQNLLRVVEQLRDSESKAVKKDRESLQQERMAYEDAIRHTANLVKILRELGQQKVAQVREMEEEMTRNRTDLYKAARNTPAKGEAEADAQNRKGETLVQPYPMHKTPSVLLSPKKLLIKAKKELQEKENSTAAAKKPIVTDDSSQTTT